MSAWVPAGSGGSTGQRQFFNSGQGAPSAMGTVYQPSAGAAPAAPAAPAQTPGVISLNPLDPNQSAQSASGGVGSLFDGLRNGLFGTDSVDSQGKHGGLLGDVPLLGDATRAVSHIGGAAGEAFGAVTGAVGGLAERIPSNFTDITNQTGKAIDAQYQQLPADFKQKWDAQINSEHGLLGTGILDNDEHLKSAAIRAYAEQQQLTNPSLLGAKFQPAGSIADTLNNLMDIMGTPAAAVERGVAGLSKANGENRLQDAVDLTKAGQATPVEQLAAAKFQHGEWTQDEALDFLATHGAGFAHDSATQVAASVLLDPLNIAAFGAGALAKLGAKGAEFVSRGDRAAQMLEEAQTELQTAQDAQAAASGAKASKLAAADVEAASAKVDSLRTSVDAFKAYRGTAEPRAVNVLGRAAQGSEKAAQLLKVVGKAYTGIEGTAVGRAAKVTRTLIDPLHAMDMRTLGGARTVDLYSDALTKTLVDTLGPTAHRQVLEDFASLDSSGALRDLFTRDLAVAVTNRGREGIADLYRAGQVNAGLGERLMETIPGDVIDEAIKTTKERDLLRWLRYDVTKNVLIRNWGEAARTDLAQRLEALYHVRPQAEWLQSMAKMSDEQLSILKHAAYGNANRQLLEGVSHSKIAGQLAVGARSVDDMVLIAKSTLTRLGGESLLQSLKTAKGQAAKLRLIEDWQGRYASLRYIAMDAANPGKSINDFTDWLSNGLDRLPMQVTHDELGTLHPELQDLQANLGDAYSLGFRPKDEFLWGLERTNAAGGRYALSGSPWVDHVADGGLGYRPGHDLTLNIAGHAIPGVKSVGRAIDYIEEGGRVLKAQVSGAQIAEAARQRFVSEASRGRFAEHGLTEAVSNQWWDRINEFTREHEGYSGPRGLGDGDLWNALFGKGLIPQPLLNGSTRLTERDIMQMVLNAYDGDVRYIGLTQKLTGRAKAYIHELTGSNFTGQIAEHLWPTMKFRYNPIFQLQEKIEPWVLNAQRGVSVATGVKLSEADVATERLLQRLTDNSVIRQADLDQAEFSAQVLHGKGMAALAATPATKVGKMKAMASSLLEVQGMKRLNMLRTFRDGLGGELRGVWEKTQPGVWDDMKEVADVRAGRILSDDDFALQLMGEQLFSNDIVVNRLAKTTRFHADPGNAIKTGAWHTPSNLGELQGLDLDYIASALHLPGENGQEMHNLGDLRRYIGENNGRLADVTEGLNRLGADPDYVTRVENALTFSWTGFWQTATERFGLTGADSRALQDMVAQAADLRDMSPADFLSQVFSPGIKDGKEGLLGSIANAKDLRSQLAGVTGESTREDLIRQMAAVFSDYLDPSAKRALLMEFKPELRQAVMDGKVKLDLNDLQSMWDSDATDALGDRITGYMDGKLGTGAHDVVEDESRGVKSVRKGAERYMEQRGVTPQPERRYYAPDQQLSEDTAAAYSALPGATVEASGRVPNIASVRKAGLDLKPKPDGMDDRTYEAYRDFVQDTRTQWDYMTSPKKKGGLGIDVTVAKTDPYADSAAMRADVAKGRLRVLGASSDHPLMTNEQNVMFRAVHDVFGHAAEGFEFGPRGELNAAIKHSQMYSDTGRAAMLTETHGQNSWVNFSNDVLPGTGEFVPSTSYEEAKAAYQKLQPDVVGAAVDTRSSPQIVWEYETAVGPGFDSLAKNGLEGEMAQALDTLRNLRTQFPSAPLLNADVFDLAKFYGPGVDGATIGAEHGNTAVILNEKMWTDPNHAAKSAEGAAAFAEIPKGGAYSFDGGLRIRSTDAGVPFVRTGNSDGVIAHEYGHVIDSWLRYGKPGIDPDKLRPYLDFADDFAPDGHGPKWMEKARNQLSEYAGTGDEEAMAELVGVAFNPSVDRASLPTELRRAADQVEALYDNMGVHVKPQAETTVRAANAAKPGTVFAPQKAALLPQDILDRFGQQFVGVGKHVESNPDVARAAQMFGKWSRNVVEDGLLKGSASPHAGLLHDVAGIPTKDAVPYNLTEGLLLQQATAAMADKWRDAYRLQYFAQERSMLERSVNHPMFGLYPASYMWGKLAPEVIRFVAQKPFGIRTGGLAYSLMDAQAQVALQREYDPAFDAKIESLGHSQALSFAGYMLPTLPWDISASAPIWMKDIAAQGLKSEASVAAGGQAQGFDGLKPAVDTLNKLNPLATTIPWAARAVGEVTKSSDKQDLQQVTLAPTKAADLGTPLSLVMQELRDTLGS